mmetsp:Transcript_70796/g.140450  ORF Transcript_70796/g.140450 Transcript_70796/m.140450 type:complete len:121 (+) Transcript_70796:205-567(+)
MTTIQASALLPLAVDPALAPAHVHLAKHLGEAAQARIPAILGSALALVVIRLLLRHNRQSTLRHNRHLPKSLNRSAFRRGIGGAASTVHRQVRDTAGMPVCSLYFMSLRLTGKWGWRALG